jgi:ferrochelatase
VKIAIVLFNLGGPDEPDAVEPFLENLFSDPAIIRLPGVFRRPLASLIARRRGPHARGIYAKIGGRSPILPNTYAQGDALDQVLRSQGLTVKSFVVMRYWSPRAEDVVRAVKEYGPDRIVTLPLYPQYSTTTNDSSEKDWAEACKDVDLSMPQYRVCCYPWEEGFIASLAASIMGTARQKKPGLSYRLLLSAHGLPERVIAGGDPYRWQVEETAKALVARLAIPDLDWDVCFQSRVGPLKWIGPSTFDSIAKAGRDGKGVILAPIAFVSEHSETLVELDIDCADHARKTGVPDYLRCPAVATHSDFIAGLARLVTKSLAEGNVTCGAGRICPKDRAACGFGKHY